MLNHPNKWFVLGFVIVVAILVSTVIVAIVDDEFVIDTFQEDGDTNSTVQTACQGNIGPILDGLDLDGITKVMIVAHPDDETLWGGAHLYEGGWLVVCLSNQTTLGGVRSAEFSAALKALGAVGVVLDYPDKGAWDDASTTASINTDVTTLLKYRGIQWEQVATHNPNGEYGHSHHRSTSGIVTSVYDAIFPGKDNLYYFGRYYSQESIDALQPLTRINSRDAVIKDHVLNNIYISQNLSAHTQMFPYENWVKRSDWDNDGVHSVIEIYGDTRIETAVAVAQEAYPDGSQGIIIASGYSFPDALIASSLAGMLGYPILLTNPTSLDSSVKDEIVALGAEKALIIGGTGVVDTGVEAALKTIPGITDVERLSGLNRYSTAAAIYTYGSAQPDGWSPTAIIVCGTRFPDALSVSPLSANEHFPVFLTQPNGLLSSVDKATIARDFDTAIIVGGSSAVSLREESELKTLGVTNVTRLAGKNRYETSCVFADWCVDQGYLVWDGVGFATGIDYPDALAGGVLQGTKNSVLLLASSAVGTEDTTMQVVPLLHNLEPDQVASMKNVHFFGGFGAFRPALRSAILASLIWRI